MKNLYKVEELRHASHFEQFKDLGVINIPAIGDVKITANRKLKPEFEQEIYHYEDGKLPEFFEIKEDKNPEHYNIVFLAVCKSGYFENFFGIGDSEYHATDALIKSISEEMIPRATSEASAAIYDANLGCVNTKYDIFEK